MLSNYLTSALRHLARNGLYAGISVFCLSVGLCVALIVGLMVRQELSFERFLPGYERTYVAASVIAPTDRSPIYFLESIGFVAASMMHMFPEIEEITRIVDATVRLRHGEFEAKERVYWADPNVFSVLRLPAIEGDLPSALEQPDGIVLTQSIAKKYFGGQSALGQTMMLNGQHVQKVTAVIRDLPYSTNLESGIFVSGLASYSGVSNCDRNDIENAKNGGVSLCGLTFFRLRDHAHVDGIRANEAALVASWHLPQNFPMAPHPSPFIRIDQIHLFDGLHPGARLRAAETAAIGLLILFAACVVYVNLTTARSSRRALEVGVRKVCGADRPALALQFLGESVLYVLLASVVAVSLAELALPYLNSFLDLHVEFAYWRDPLLLAEIAVCMLVIGILSGAYPAIVLSAFKPVDVLKGPIGLPGGTRARQVLVVIQLAILIGLLSAGAIIYQQRQFATHDAVRLNVDRAFVLAGPCVPPLVEGIRRRPDVEAVVCSDNGLLKSESFSFMKLKSGTPITVYEMALDFEAFRFYGISLSATAITPRDLNSAGTSNQDRVIINESLARALGFRSPVAALSQPLELRSADSKKDDDPSNQELSVQPLIIGVVPDFALSAAKEPIRPTIYRSLEHPTAAPKSPDDSGNPLFTWGSLIHVRLNDRSTPETFKAIDNLWVAAIHSDSLLSSRDIWRRSLRDYLQGLYKDVLKQAQTFGLFSVIAIILSSFGLLGLAAAAAERRTKEIGIRKAMGAGRGDVLRMLLRQFTLPVLWASLIAWPVSAILMNHWLLTFAQHIRLPPLVFLAASSLTLVICLLTVSIHAWRVANAAPVIALKYE
jgi:putative ABC transport system permease protein